MKSDNFLHKQGFVDSQSQTTVHLEPTQGKQILEGEETKNIEEN